MIIDRFEGEYAICEDSGTMISIKSDQLPKDCREGDQIALEHGVYVKVDNRAERERIRKKMDALFKH